MDILSIGQSVLAFIVAIGVLVTVHEFGHFWVARRMGVKVLRFSVGFGKPLVSWRAGPDQTEYLRGQRREGQKIGDAEQPKEHPARQLKRHAVYYIWRPL